MAFRKLVARVMVLAVLVPSVGWAGTPYSVQWAFTEENPKCETAELKDHDGEPFFSVIAVQPSGKFDLGVSVQGGSEGSNLILAALRKKAAEQHLRAAALYRDVRVRTESRALPKFR